MVTVIRRNPPAVQPAPDPEVIKSDIQGEPGTGYEGPDKGDFECHNCKYFDSDTVSCGNENMMKLSKRPKIENGRVVVNPEGCCEYIERIGPDDYNEEND